MKGSKKYAKQKQLGDTLLTFQRKILLSLLF